LEIAWQEAAVAYFETDSASLRSIQVKSLVTVTAQSEA
jgi:hypothetical protein